MKFEEIKTKGEARDMAIEWQNQASETSFSYGELAVYSDFFYRLGKKFGLVREFKENGII